MLSIVIENLRWFSLCVLLTNLPYNDKAVLKIRELGRQVLQYF